MFELHTSIEINSTADRVWSILTDFPSYPEWNPFIREIHGDVSEGARLKIHLQPSGGKVMTFHPIILKLNPRREFRWLGRLLLPGTFDGEHRFVIETLDDNRVRFEQSEKFGGVLVPFLRRNLDRDTRRGFEEMNVALKQRAQQADSVAEPNS